MRRLGDSPIKRIFGYFLGACKKLPAQQSGKKVRNTKRLNGSK
jgi:lipase chaperone LimK